MWIGLTGYAVFRFPHGMEEWYFSRIEYGGFNEQCLAEGTIWYPRCLDEGKLEKVLSVILNGDNELLDKILEAEMKLSERIREFLEWVDDEDGMCDMPGWMGDSEWFTYENGDCEEWTGVLLREAKDEVAKLEAELQQAQACHFCDKEAVSVLCQFHTNEMLIGSHTDKEWRYVQEQLEQSRQRERELREAGDELADLVDSIREGEYIPDSFTTQPMRQALKEK